MWKAPVVSAGRLVWPVFICISGNEIDFKTYKVFFNQGQADQLVVLGIILRASGFQGQTLNPEFSGCCLTWLRSPMCLDLSSSDLTMCRSGPVCWNTWGRSPERTWLCKPSSSPASAKQLNESQALWRTEAADGGSCSHWEMQPRSVLLPSGDREIKCNWHVLKPFHPFVWFNLAICVCLAKKKCINCSASMTNGG